jgi:hypothetical protein
MNTLNLLVGGAERGLNNLIEAAILDVCYDQAAVECSRVGRADEFLRHASYGAFQLVVITPECLMGAPRRRGAYLEFDEVVDVVRAVKQHTSTPLVAVGVLEDKEWMLLEAGADHVLGKFEVESFKATIREVLKVSVRTEPVKAPARAFGHDFFRGLLGLKSA